MKFISELFLPLRMRPRTSGHFEAAQLLPTLVPQIRLGIEPGCWFPSIAAGFGLFAHPSAQLRWPARCNASFPSVARLAISFCTHPSKAGERDDFSKRNVED